MPVSQNEFQKEIIVNLYVDNQMLGTCGSYEPFNTPKTNYLVV